MKVIVQEFPFIQYGRGRQDLDQNSVDRYGSWKEAKEDKWDDRQIWSIVSGDDLDVWTYGPPHHFVNDVDFIATTEFHDNETYYEEHWPSDFSFLLETD